jgi:hypothetical protein
VDSAEPQRVESTLQDRTRNSDFASSPDSNNDDHEDVQNRNTRNMRKKKAS